MPPIEVSNRFQKVLLWTRISEDRYGIPTLNPVQEILARWENKKGEMLDDKNQVVGIDARVHVVIALPIGSLMWEGKLSDFPSDTTSITNLMQVIACEDAKDIKGRQIRREYGLKRFTQKLPNITV